MKAVYLSPYTILHYPRRHHLLGHLLIPLILRIMIDVQHNQPYSSWRMSEIEATCAGKDICNLPWPVTMIRSLSLVDMTSSRMTGINQGAGSFSATVEWYAFNQYCNWLWLIRYLAQKSDFDRPLCSNFRIVLNIRDRTFCLLVMWCRLRQSTFSWIS